jgi:hypothetical protein
VLSSLRAGLAEVEVFDRHGPRPGRLRGGNQGGDGGADASVAGRRGKVGKLQRDGERRPCDVAVRGDRGDREVPGVQVHRHDGSRCQVAQGRHGPRRGPPRRVGVPAPPHRVVGDVVAHSPGGGLGGDLVAPVLEPDLAGQPVAAVPPVREVH